jgi:hypothetical protein
MIHGSLVLVLLIAGSVYVPIFVHIPYVWMAERGHPGSHPSTRMYLDRLYSYNRSCLVTRFIQSCPGETAVASQARQKRSISAYRWSQAPELFLHPAGQAIKAIQTSKQEGLHVLGQAHLSYSHPNSPINSNLLSSKIIY